MVESGIGAQQHRRSLAAFLRANAGPIMAEWMAAVRGSIAAARQLGDETLLDRLPRILERIAELAEGLELGAATSTPPTTMRHALERLAEGYGLGEVVTEYALLRDVLHRRWFEVEQSELGFDLVHRVIDEAVASSVDHYALASHRMLRAVDRISTEALGTGGLEGLLERLLDVLMDASPTVDEATILLVEGGRLVVRAAAGVTSERDARFSMAFGEGFAGRIAETRQPYLLRDAAANELVVSRFLRAAGIRALYGVPLEAGAEVIGVAHMGSKTAYEFPDEDQMLFRAMANRASAFIIEAQLRDRERQAFLEAERARALLEGILDATMDPIAVVDLDGRIVAGSATPGPRIAGALQRDLQRCIEHRVSCRGEIAGERTFEYMISPIAVPDGMPAMAVVVSRDVTDRRRADRDRERLIGVLGHDLRNPLSAVQIAVAQLQRDPGLDERNARIVERIGGSADRMQRLIEQLVDFARARLGKGIPIQRVPTDLAAVCRNVLEELALAHPRRHIEATLDEGLTGEWDPDRLGQVISNLVANALEHGGDPVRVVGRSGRTEVVLEVANQGSLAAEDIPSLFEPFKGSRRHGLGLGLYIVGEIVKAHGGTVEVRSDDGETVFVTTWPRATGTRP